MHYKGHLHEDYFSAKKKQYELPVKTTRDFYKERPDIRDNYFSRKKNGRCPKVAAYAFGYPDNVQPS